MENVGVDTDGMGTCLGTITEFDIIVGPNGLTIIDDSFETKPTQPKLVDEDAFTDGINRDRTLVIELSWGHMDENLTKNRDHCDHSIEDHERRLVQTQRYRVVVYDTKNLVDTLISVEKPRFIYNSRQL